MVLRRKFENQVRARSAGSAKLTAAALTADSDPGEKAALGTYRQWGRPWSRGTILPALSRQVDGPACVLV